MIIDARHHDPFAFLGLHQEGKNYVFRTFQPLATQVSLKTKSGWTVLERTHHHGLYEWRGTEALICPCQLLIEHEKHAIETYETYSFQPLLSDVDLHLFGEGQLNEAYNSFGARMMEHQGIKGARFCVWAPNAERVSVIGDFNQWDGRVNQMRIRGSSGVWELFIPNLGEGELYKFEIRNRHTSAIMVKIDPYAQAYETRPGNAAKVISASRHKWQDASWLEQRASHDWMHAPFNCYEIHPGSWKRNAQGEFLTYRELADQLVPYLSEMGYTHIELLPITEHPLNESWGYQTTGYFAATNRFGTPNDLRYFIDACHQANIGVILDWVPGHFPKDDWALARFDGTALYEHEDPRLGEHQDWGTYIFNYGRNEVRNFLISSAYYWLKEFHIDGLRVDAVASMLSVSRPIYLGGLGFSMKWNMGWMNDTLSYMQNDPVHRRYHHDKLTFGQLYAYSENFVLPFSHDEVVHGKKSLLDKMPGDAWQKFANLRLLLTLQMTHPGKKLNFMGNEFAQGREWNVNQSLDWHLLENEWHRGVHRATLDLNNLYKASPALYDLDFDHSGFQWIDCHDSEQSIVSYIRQARDGKFLVVVLNFTPVLRTGYRVGVPQSGFYREIFNSDAACYGGSNQGNGQGLHSDNVAWMNQPDSLLLTIPPLAGVILSI